MNIQGIEAQHRPGVRPIEKIKQIDMDWWLNLCGLIY